MLIRQSMAYIILILILLILILILILLFIMTTNIIRSVQTHIINDIGSGFYPETTVADLPPLEASPCVVGWIWPASLVSRPVRGLGWIWPASLVSGPGV